MPPAIGRAPALLSSRRGVTGWRMDILTVRVSGASMPAQNPPSTAIAHRDMSKLLRTERRVFCGHGEHLGCTGRVHAREGFGRRILVGEWRPDAFQPMLE